MLNANFI